MTVHDISGRLDDARRRHEARQHVNDALKRMEETTRALFELAGTR
jgi:hypothetical protein